MTTTFTQNHTEEFSFDDITQEQFLNLAVQTSKTLGWIFSNINKVGFTAYTNNGIFNWNAEVKLSISDSTAKILSQSRNIRVVEFGRDKNNIATFIATFNSLKSTLFQAGISSFSNLQSHVA